MVHGSTLLLLPSLSDFSEVWGVYLVQVCNMFSLLVTVQFVKDD